MNATSYDLNDMERFNAAYIGAYKNYCEEIALDDFFIEHRVFSAADIRRMKDVSFVASLTSTMLSDYFHRDEEIENFLERYDEEFEHADEMKQRFESTLLCIHQMNFDRSSRAWKKADFYTLFVEVDRILHRDNVAVVPEVAGRKLDKFFEDVNQLRESEDAPVGNVGDYFRATLQSTNDRTTRATRGRIVREVLLAA